MEKVGGTCHVFLFVHLHDLIDLSVGKISNLVAGQDQETENLNDDDDEYIIYEGARIPKNLL